MPGEGVLRELRSREVNLHVVVVDIEGRSVGSRPRKYVVRVRLYVLGYWSGRIQSRI